MSSDKIKLTRIKDKVFMLHRESTLAVKSQTEKRCVVGRFEGTKFFPVDEKTRQICKEYAPEYKFYIENEPPSSEEESSEQSSDEESSEKKESPEKNPSPVKKESLVQQHPSPKTEISTPPSPNEDSSEESSDEETSVHPSTPVNTPLTAPVKVEFIGKDNFSLSATPTTVHSSPLEFFQTFENAFNDYVEQKKEEITMLEKRKSTLLSQVETMEKQIRAIKSMFL